MPENIDIRLRPLSGQAEGSRDSLEEKLDQLRKLKDKGKITAAEYDKMRQELLASPAKGKIAATPAKVETGDKFGPDQALIKASFAKAKELGYNGIPIYVRTGGNIVICAGAMFNMVNNQFQWTDNDMIVNVCDFPIPLGLGGVILSTGEYVVVKNGNYEKQPGRITAD